MVRRILKKKPDWWHLKWLSICKGGNSREDLVQLVHNVYRHYGHEIDESSVSSSVDTLIQDAGSFECYTNEPPGVSGPSINQIDVPSDSIGVFPVYSTVNS